MAGKRSRKRSSVSSTESRLKIFIGSSVEKLWLATAVQKRFEFYKCDAIPWDADLFLPSRYTLETLLKITRDFDVAIFIFAPDDVSRMRKHYVQAVRDNVVFELGLFMGVLGRDRTFVIVPRGMEDLHLPTDLIGVTPATYDSQRAETNESAALGYACDQIWKAIRPLEPIHRKNQPSDRELLEAIHSFLMLQPSMTRKLSTKGLPKHRIH